MPDIPTTEPTVFIAGDTVKWTKSVPDYLASDGYTLKYIFNFRSSVESTKKTVTASASGDDYSVTIAAATTAGYAAGVYDWTAYVEKASERYTVDSGTCTVKPDPANVASGTDLRSHARKVLDAIEATLEGTATSDQKRMKINDTEIDKYDIPELLHLRSFYKTEVAREEEAEKIANGLSTGRRVLTRFVK